ncbi:MAG: hypothetical protein JKY99_09545 [Rhizobiales bacterium]|nr:hypothetical protein [Hyphomicrobiales bacterium]
MRSIITAPLFLFSRHAQWVLIAGLVAGVAFPASAGFLRPHIPVMVALILFLSALRMDISALNLRRAVLLKDLGLVLALQIISPFVAYTVLTLMQAPEVWRDVLTVLFSSAAITGIPAFSFLMGLDGARAMRILVIGTALLPLTTLPVLAILPNVAAETSLLGVSLKMLALIIVAAIAALTLRKPVMRLLGEDGPQLLNGLNALALAIFVLALMDAVQPVLLSDPLRLLGILAIAISVNIGPQIAFVVWASWRAKASGTIPSPSDLTPSLACGLRNMALFLAALPASVTDPWLLFIGCYQVPMYLTPLLMRPVLAWAQARAATNSQ